MKPLIVALDVDTDKEALSLVKATRAHADIYKIGPPLILRYGPAIIKSVAKLGKKIFLDLKFHDIPNTMARSIQEAGALKIYSATVHLSAGESALKTALQIKKRPRVWGVTVLTSLTHHDMMELGFRHGPAEQVEHLAALARRCRLDGVVASVGETALLRQVLGSHFTIITPGIRLPGDAINDQKRIATPSHARHAGANFIVVGRPIIEAKHPEAAAAQILKDWSQTPT